MSRLEFIRDTTHLASTVLERGTDALGSTTGRFHGGVRKRVGLQSGTPLGDFTLDTPQPRDPGSRTDGEPDHTFEHDSDRPRSAGLGPAHPPGRP